MTKAKFNDAAQLAFSMTVANSTGSVCGADGKRLCTAPDVTITSVKDAQRRADNIDVSFAVKTFKAAAAANGANKLDASLNEPTTFVASLKATAAVVQANAVAAGTATGVGNPFAAVTTIKISKSPTVVTTVQYSVGGQVVTGEEVTTQPDRTGEEYYQTKAISGTSDTDCGDDDADCQPVVGQVFAIMLLVGLIVSIVSIAFLCMRGKKDSSL